MKSFREELVQQYDKGLFSEQTENYGSGNFNYAIYARLSKINKKPCIHYEWRIKGASEIKKGQASLASMISRHLFFKVF